MASRVAEVEIKSKRVQKEHPSHLKQPIETIEHTLASAEYEQAAKDLETLLRTQTQVLFDEMNKVMKSF